MAKIDYTDPQTKALLVAIGEDLRRIRESVDNVPQEAVAEILDFAGRDAISKVERGDLALSLHRYLKVMDFYRELQPDHPGVALADYFKARARTKLRVVKS